MRPSRLSLIPLLGCTLLLTACPESTTGTGNDDTDEDFTTPGTIVKSGSGFPDAGDNQSVPAGSRYPAPLAVTVFTPGGKKCNGCIVQWSLSPGQFNGGNGGVVSTRTDVFGIVLFNVTSLTPRGTYQVRAAIANGQSVIFTLNAT